QRLVLRPIEQRVRQKGLKIACSQCIGGALEFEQGQLVEILDQPRHYLPHAFGQFSRLLPQQQDIDLQRLLADVNLLLDAVVIAQLPAQYADQQWVPPRPRLARLLRLRLRHGRSRFGANQDSHLSAPEVFYLFSRSPNKISSTDLVPSRANSGILSAIPPSNRTLRARSRAMK